MNRNLPGFQELYSEVLRTPSKKHQYRAQLYEFTIAVQHSQNLQQKEEILSKLLILYPEDTDLYVKMAQMNQPINIERAIMWHKIAHKLDPTHSENMIQLCQLFLDTGLSAHLFEMNQNQELEPLLENPEFLSVYSRCHFQQLHYKDGLAHLLKLIQISSTKPCKTRNEKYNKWRNYHDIGYVYCALGETEKAIQYTNKASDLAVKFDLDLKDKLLSFSNSLCYLDFTYSDNTQAFQRAKRINDYYPETRVFSFSNSEPNENKKQKQNQKQKQKQKQKIRIGYLSSDFTYHAVANFIIPILENHDPTQFEITLFAHSTPPISDKFSQLNLPTTYIHQLSDQEAARKIHALKIDILIDLNGHTVNNRLGIFALQPAPVQITYLGYPNTTGLNTIQYRITDAIADHPDTTQHYSEKLIRLPGCFLLYKSITQPIPTIPRKTQPNQIILGAVNKENKNSPFVLETWKRILAECPTTKILIKLETFDNNEERMVFYTSRLDVPRTRIVLLNKLSNENYNRLFTMFDILLDTFPYSGTTTTCNALHNSVPVVTLYHKDHHCHNVSASILTNAQLPELVAQTEDEYVEIVKDLVNRPERIDAYKATIHKKFAELMEPTNFLKSYERELLDKCK